MKLTKRRFMRWAVVVLMIAVSLLLVTIPSARLISLIGSENGYIFMYLIAFVGSISTFASIPYPLFLISLAAGGFNPILIGLTSAAGVMTSDSVTFFAAGRGRALLSDKLQAAMRAVSVHIERHPKWLTPGLVGYGTFSPLSNDFAVITLALMKYRYLQVIPALAVGNIIYNIAIAYLAVYAHDWIAGLF